YSTPHSSSPSPTRRSSDLGHHGAKHRGAVQAKGAQQNGHGHNHLGKPIEKHADGRVQVRFFEQWDFYAVRHFSSSYINLSMVRRSEEHTSELQSRFDLVCR